MAEESKVRVLLEHIGQRTQCRGRECRATVWWVKTWGDQRILVEEDGDLHFPKCVSAGEFAGRARR